MPPLASLAASLLVASPPPAACGPPCLSRQRRRKPSLPSAYPQPTLSLPSNPFPSRSRRRRRRGCRRWRAWRRFRSWPLPSCHWWPAPPHAARGDAGGGPAHLPHSLLSNPFLSPRCAAAACRQGDGKRSKKVEPGAGTALPGGTAAQGPAAKVCRMRASAVGALRPSAYPQPTLSLPSAYPQPTL